MRLTFFNLIKLAQIYNRFCSKMVLATASINMNETLIQEFIKVIKQPKTGTGDQESDQEFSNEEEISNEGQNEMNDDLAEGSKNQIFNPIFYYSRFELFSFPQIRYDISSKFNKYRCTVIDHLKEVVESGLITNEEFVMCLEGLFVRGGRQISKRSLYSNDKMSKSISTIKDHSGVDRLFKKLLEFGFYDYLAKRDQNLVGSLFVQQELSKIMSNNKLSTGLESMLYGEVCLDLIDNIIQIEGYIGKDENAYVACKGIISNILSFSDYCTGFYLKLLPIINNFTNDYNFSKNSSADMLESIRENYFQKILDIGSDSNFFYNCKAIIQEIDEMLSNIEDAFRNYIVSLNDKELSALHKISFSFAKDIFLIRAIMTFIAETKDYDSRFVYTGRSPYKIYDKGNRLSLSLGNIIAYTLIYTLGDDSSSLKLFEIHFNSSNIYWWTANSIDKYFDFREFGRISKNSINRAVTNTSLEIEKKIKDFFKEVIELSNISFNYLLEKSNKTKLKEVKDGLVKLINTNDKKLETLKNIGKNIDYISNRIELLKEFIIPSLSSSGSRELFRNLYGLLYKDMRIILDLISDL